MTPRRIIGTLSIRPLADEKAYSIHGRVRLGQKLAIKKKDGATFQYGGLLVRLRENNYADVITESSENYWLQSPKQYRSTEIVLRDEHSVKSGGKKQKTYTSGTEQFFTVEVSPADSPAAVRVKRHELPGGLRALEVRADGEWLMLIHNPRNAAVTANVASPATVSICRFQAQGEPSTPTIETLRGGRIRCTVPAKSHVVLTAAETEKQ